MNKLQEHKNVFDHIVDAMEALFTVMIVIGVFLMAAASIREIAHWIRGM